MKKIRIVIHFCLLAMAAKAQTISVSGTISTNTIWNVDTVKITNNLFVSSSATLTINPGTYVEFQGYYELQVSGKLHALGSISDSITFTIKDTTGYSNQSNTLGGWKRIYISNSSTGADSTIFEYCKFKYNKFSGVYRHQGNVRIEHCLFDKSLFAIVLYNAGRSIVKDNEFSNITSTAIAIYSGNNSLISSNLFSNNNGYCIYSSGSFPEITNNIISNNKGSIITTIQNGPSSSSGAIVDNNEFSNNDGVSLIVKNDTNAVISNNTIKYNNQVGLMIQKSSPKIISNTIAYNTSDQGGTGIYLLENSNPLIIFNKIANNYSSNAGCGFTDGGAGIKCTGSSPIIVNNLICNNETESDGGGLNFRESSKAIVFNNTIVNNKSNDKILGCGGISAAWLLYEGVYKNNIVWGNESPDSSKQMLAYTYGSLFDVDYNDFMDTLSKHLLPVRQSVNYQNLMMLDPLFVSPSAGTGYKYDGLTANWSLQEGSPCIDAGTPDTTGLYLYPNDIAGNVRIQTRVDMGAYEYTPSTSVSIENIFADNLISIYPNPSNGKFSLAVVGVKQSQIKNIEVYNLLGEMIFQSAINSQQSIIDLSTQPNGIYLLNCFTDKGNQMMKIIKK